MAQWYYSKGDQEFGPVDEKVVLDLIERGEISPDDDVWKEGMPEWIRAGEVPELFGSDPPAPPAPTALSAPRRTARGSAAAPIPIEPLLRWGRTIGQPLLIVGFVLVLWSKGCDTVGDHRVARAAALAESAPRQFKYEFETRRLRLVNEREQLEDKKEPSTSDLERLREIDDRLGELQNEMDDEQKALTRGRWRELQYAADNASASNRMWAYWREMFFVFGSMLLSIGLLAVAFTGQTSERWVCLIMLAIIAFSIFIGGVAWTGPLLGGT